MMVGSGSARGGGGGGGGGEGGMISGNCSDGSGVLVQTATLTTLSTVKVKLNAVTAGKPPPIITTLF